MSNEAGNLLPAHFVDNVLPKLFEEVSKCHELELKVSGTNAKPKKDVKKRR
jgi:hypothetical protein